MEEQSQHSFEIDADPQNVWGFFWDIQAMAKCIPGCEEVATVEEHQSYRAQVRRKMGPFLTQVEQLRRQIDPKDSARADFSQKL